MKKQLLTATIMLTGMFVLTPSIADAKSSMDSNLKLLWMITYSNDHANRHVRFDSFYCRCEVFYGFKS